LPAARKSQITTLDEGRLAAAGIAADTTRALARREARQLDLVMHPLDLLEVSEEEEENRPPALAMA
jgi:hypothetical protein